MYRATRQKKADYFTKFLKKKSQGVIDFRHIYNNCNTAVDAGTNAFSLNGDKKVPARYTFTYKYFGK